MIELGPRVPTEELEMPEAVQALLYFEELSGIYMYPKLEFPDGESATTTDEVAVRYGLDPEDERTQAIVRATRMLGSAASSDAPVYHALNTALLYRATGLYTPEEMEVAITGQLHPLMFEMVDEWTEKGEDFTEVFLAAMDEGRALVMMADFLDRYVEDVTALKAVAGNP